MWFTLHTPTYAYKGKQRLVRELPKKWRRTEVSVPYSGSGSAIGWHNNTLKIDLMFVYADAISIRILHVRALLAAPRPSHRKARVMEVPSILQGHSLKRLLQGAAAGAVATMIVGFNWGG